MKRRTLRRDLMALLIGITGSRGGEPLAFLTGTWTATAAAIMAGVGGYRWWGLHKAALSEKGTRTLWPKQADQVFIPSLCSSLRGGVNAGAFVGLLREGSGMIDDISINHFLRQFRAINTGILSGDMLVRHGEQIWLTVANNKN